MNIGIMLKGVLNAFNIKVSDEQAAQVEAAIPGMIGLLQTLPAQLPVLLARLSDGLNKFEAMQTQIAEMRTLLQTQHALARPGMLGAQTEAQYRAMMLGKLPGQDNYVERENDDDGNGSLFGAGDGDSTRDAGTLNGSGGN